MVFKGGDQNIRLFSTEMKVTHDALCPQYLRSRDQWTSTIYHVYFLPAKALSKLRDDTVKSSDTKKANQRYQCSLPNDIQMI